MKLSGSLITASILTAALVTGYAQEKRGAWPPALQPASDTSPVLSPDAAMKTIIMPPGYRLELVASEPMIQDPVVIDWDADGRLWAIEMPGYMTDIQASHELDPLGRVVVLRGHERRRQDGQADRLCRRAGAGARAEGAGHAACSSASRRTCGSCRTPTAT